jgi:hypothetical protein
MCLHPTICLPLAVVLEYPDSLLLGSTVSWSGPLWSPALIPLQEKKGTRL